MHDWFIGSTVINRGIPRSVIYLTKTFVYYDIDEIDVLLDPFDGKVAAIVLEPAGFDFPSPGYLVELKRCANDRGFKHTSDRVFVMSSTYGAERASIAAGVTPIRKMQDSRILTDKAYVGEKLVNCLVI